MALNFSWIETVPQLHKNCVFGYVRDVQQRLLPAISSYYNIPSLATYLILQYYYHGELFDIHGEQISLDDTKSIASINHISTNTVYGTVVIDFSKSFIYKWTIRMNENDGDSKKIAIGIAAEKQIKATLEGNADFTYCSDDDFIAYHSRSVYWGADKFFEIEYDEFATNSGEEYTKNDVIKMEITQRIKEYNIGKIRNLSVFWKRSEVLWCHLLLLIIR